MSDWDAHHPALWPGESQRLLLKALLLRGEAARCAWRQWSATYDLANVDVEDSALLPPLYLAAQRLGIDPPIRSLLREAYRASWLKNQMAIMHLQELLKSLDELKLPTVILKGVALLLFHYRDVGARRMGDVDILVKEADLPLAARTLESLGWRSKTSVPPPEVLPYHHAMEWTCHDGFRLDLHWRVWTTDGPPWAEEAFWQRCSPREYCGIKLRVPEPADLLILMCYHGRKQDRVSRARWVLDVAQIVDTSGSEIDWPDVQSRAIQCGLAVPVNDALDCVRREYAVPVPTQSLPTIEREGDTDAATRYMELARHQLLDRGLVEVVASAWWRYAAVQRAREGAPSLAGFLVFYLADRQWEWGLEHKWQVPWRALQKAVQRLRAHGV